MSDSTFTLRVEKQLKEDFIEAAKVADRPGAQLIRDFMRDYVQQHQESFANDALRDQQAQDEQISSDKVNIVSKLLRELAANDRKASSNRRRE